MTHGSNSGMLKLLLLREISQQLFSFSSWKMEKPRSTSLNLKVLTTWPLLVHRSTSHQKCTTITEKATSVIIRTTSTHLECYCGCSLREVGQQDLKFTKTWKLLRQCKERLRMESFRKDCLRWTMHAGIWWWWEERKKHWNGKRHLWIEPDKVFLPRHFDA